MFFLFLRAAFICLHANSAESTERRRVAI